MCPSAGEVSSQTFGQQLPANSASHPSIHEPARYSRYGSHFEMEKSTEEEQCAQRSHGIADTNREGALRETSHPHQTEKEREQIRRAPNQKKQTGGKQCSDGPDEV